MSELKTPLYERHVALGGKMVPFANYLLPVTYKDTSLILEHQAVREQAGLFDVSHMGAIFLEGSDALANLQYILTNDFSNLTDGQVRYTLMLNEAGGVIDDFIVYRYQADKYLLVVNAANRQKDYDWLVQHVFGDCQVRDDSDKIAILALQGPNAKLVLEKILPEATLPDKYYRFVDEIEFNGHQLMISQTGYTGEFGYELYIPAEGVGFVWDELLKVGAEFGLIPAGLGARDTLRLEASLPLYGHEMDETTLPQVANLNFAVKLGKEDFIGKAAVAQVTTPEFIRVGLKVTGKGIVREDAEIVFGDEVVGHSTSGTHSPTLGYPIAMAQVKPEFSELGTKLEAQVRRRKIEVEVVAMPFYKRKK